MQYLIRFLQTHDTFRQPETDALAELAGTELQWVWYSNDTPFAIVAFPDDVDAAQAAQTIASRSILISTIHELWGQGTTYDELYSDVRSRSQEQWQRYEQASFRFDLDTYQGSRSSAWKREIIETFDFLDFKGPIVMKKPDCVFTIFEEFAFHGKSPTKLYLGRLVAESGRKVMNTYNLKKRRYIATTSMDAELSLITANIALAAPGKLAYDPFMGTGSFPVSCACYEATVFGSDLDGRSIRGKAGKSVLGNFEQYGTVARYLGGFAADVTNTPLISRRILDIVVCDPPYGVREGLKVLGHTKERLQGEVVLNDGTLAHLRQDYVPPKRPYSFVRMLDDILDFSAARLVDGGRLCMWMPVGASSEDADLQAEQPEEVTEYDIPRHPHLELHSLCRQDFNKWSRRLLTYRRRKDSEVDQEAYAAYEQQRSSRDTSLLGSANDLNIFRKQYFNAFRE